MSLKHKDGGTPRKCQDNAPDNDSDQCGRQQARSTQHAMHNS